jgi:hypothetical protein
MSYFHPDLMPKPGIESHERRVQSEDDEESEGNPRRLKCPKCGEIPLHYRAHLKVCKGR